MNHNDLGPRERPLMVPAWGPLMTVQAPGTPQEQVILGVEQNVMNIDVLEMDYQIFGDIGGCRAAWF